jgi:hypothetical protein
VAVLSEHLWGGPGSTTDGSGLTFLDRKMPVVDIAARQSRQQLCGFAMKKSDDIERMIDAKRTEIRAAKLALHSRRIELESLEKLRHEMVSYKVTTRTKGKKTRSEKDILAANARKTRNNA